MYSSLNKDIDDGVSLLNQAKAGPFNVIPGLDTHAAPFGSCKC